MSESSPEPVGRTEPTPSAPWRAVALALAGALALVAGLVASAPLWAPLLSWSVPAEQGETRQLADRVDRLASAENAIGQRVEQTSIATGETVRRLDRRVAALEAKPATPASADVAELRQHLTAVSNAAEKLGGRIDALDKAMRAPAAPDASDLALAVAVGAVRDAVAAGQPFGAQYDALAALARGRPDIAEAARPLAAVAQDGVPARAALAADGLRRLVADGGTAQTPPPARTGWRGAILARLAGLVRIRRVDDAAAPSGEPTAVADAKRALAAGDLAGAVAALDKLSPPPQAAATWLRLARQRLAVDAAVLRSETLAAAHLAAAAPTAPAGTGPHR